MNSVERTAARRGLSIHLELFAIVALVALLSIPLFGSVVRSVSTGMRCAARGYSTVPAPAPCER